MSGRSGRYTSGEGSLGFSIDDDLAPNGVLVTDSTETIDSKELSSGQLIIGRSGMAPTPGYLTGRADSILVTNSAGAISLRTPQDIGTSSAPTFASISAATGNFNRVNTSTIGAGGQTYLTMDSNTLYLAPYDVIGLTGAAVQGQGMTYDSAILGAYKITDKYGTGEQLTLAPNFNILSSLYGTYFNRRSTDSKMGQLSSDYTTGDFTIKAGEYSGVYDVDGTGKIIVKSSSLEPSISTTLGSPSNPFSTGYLSGAGIGTSSPSRALEVNNATGQCLRLSFNAPTGSATICTDLSVGSDGSIVIAPTGGIYKLTSGNSLGPKRLVLQDNGRSADNYQYTGIGIAAGTNTVIYSTFANNWTHTFVQGDNATASSELMRLTCSATEASRRMGVGTSAPTRKVDINDPGGSCLRLSYNAPTTTATVYSDFTVAFDGKLSIVPSGAVTINNGSFIPSTDNARELGGVSNRWSTMYATTSTVTSSNATTVNATTLNSTNCTLTGSLNFGATAGDFTTALRIRHTGDADSGFAFYSDGQLGLRCNNVDALRIVTAGNPQGPRIGISTDVPQRKLEVNEYDGNCMRLSYRGTSGVAATAYADFFISSAGNYTIDPIGGTVATDGNLQPSSNLTRNLGAVGAAWANVYAGTGVFTTLSVSGGITTSNPSFKAFVSPSVLNVSGAGATYKLLFNNEEHDTASNFNTTTGEFTVPIAGRYRFSTSVYLADLLNTHTVCALQILKDVSGVVTSIALTQTNPWSLATPGTVCTVRAETTANLAVGTKVYVNVQVSGGTATVDITNGEAYTQFCGHLIQ